MTQAPFFSTMMHAPMTVAMIARHGMRIHSRSRVITCRPGGDEVATFAEVYQGAARLAQALGRLGVGVGDRVATLCWNHRWHLEAYLAVPSMGAVLHTLNLRLHPEQLAYVIRHAEDRVLIVDAELLSLLAPVAEALAGVEHLVVVGGDGEVPALGAATHRYEALLAGEQPVFPEVALAETWGAAMCYTTGTTGHPKGVVYSHKTIFVHTLASMARDTFGIGQDDRILLLPPMFHANAWGLPYTAWFAGADLILPGPHLKATDIRGLVERYRPTFTAMVPTLINDLLALHRESPLDLSSLRVIVSGGSAVAPALIERVRDTWGVPVLQGWGMTETSPLCALSVPPRDATPEEEIHWRSLAGRPVPGMQVRIADEADLPLPEDGRTVGQLQLRGPWVTGGYYRHEGESPLTADGWLRTGDLGTIDERGYVRIVDRLKDVIKSGGEWISSVDLEAALLRLPGVAEAAVIAVPDPRWEERPLAVVRLEDPSATPDIPAWREALRKQVASFWVPEYWAVVDDLPKTSVGKVDKKALRAMRDSGRLPIAEVRNRRDADAPARR
ncbi:MAG: long-chain-fatty-acid--CoA ligase [Porticoccaceae bacterium]|nr:MAG: long-chain-fatty-acid--CoA ligase [Porticoccaceae bacterium]